MTKPRGAFRLIGFVNKTSFSTWISRPHPTSTLPWLSPTAQIDLATPLPPRFPPFPPFPPVTWRLAVTHRSLGFVVVARSPVLLKDARGEQTNKKRKTGSNCLFFFKVLLLYLLLGKKNPESAEAAGKRYLVKGVIFSPPRRRWVAGSRLRDRALLRCGKWSPSSVLRKNEVETR